ncbi:hypothetical protein BDZ89DRAFT_1182464 [Hymenopellis radicata]|nr:hypothetical protein BDZ89DRAFT_1182464 [Hymenopellis radicata]
MSRAYDFSSAHHVSSSCLDKLSRFKYSHKVLDESNVHGDIKFQECRNIIVMARVCRTVAERTAARTLCIADIRGRISALNDLACEIQAIAIIHTGDFGFVTCQARATVFEILKIPSPCEALIILHHQRAPLNSIVGFLIINLRTTLSATSSCVAAANMSSTTFLHPKPHGSPSHRSSAKNCMTASSAVVSSLHILKDRSQRREASLSSQILARAQRGSIACRGLAWFDKICSSELLYRKHIFSSVFEAYQSREFLGMQTIHLIVRKEYARLSCSFSEQGIKIWTVRMWASTAWFLIAPQDRGGAGPKNALDGPAGGREEAYSHARGLACLSTRFFRLGAIHVVKFVMTPKRGVRLRSEELRTCGWVARLPVHPRAKVGSSGSN